MSACSYKVATDCRGLKESQRFYELWLDEMLYNQINSDECTHILFKKKHFIGTLYHSDMF